ncbi:hypothetical protein Desaci_2125 [Desulfosporosinus acidiphilus SJ4]|uniref:Uncharacterized protein n=1 Tax=Desulfosporosinus acidiphilus (strain DSM 22704 / JCM 16185 / SJ4) TaxID=646529 RepID=I4D5L7_DESAJ|nr:hypothetical protein [Desulfosporosinus acidiphilus]AFM41091.1 hypothetical protein Desaci_2125 [Desulfosporosinus acidiphilus SJ4]
MVLKGEKEMFIFPAIIDPTFPIILSLLVPLGIPIIVVTFVVWHVKKLNKIEKILNDIQEKLN